MKNSGSTVSAGADIYFVDSSSRQNVLTPMLGRLISYSSVAVHLVALPKFSSAQPLHMSCLITVEQTCSIRHAVQPSPRALLGRDETMKKTQERHPKPLISYYLKMCELWMWGENVSDRWIPRGSQLRPFRESATSARRGSMRNKAEKRVIDGG